MDSPFSQLAINVQGMIEDLSTIIVDEMAKNSAEIIDMNVEQLSIGESALDQNLPNLKDPMYEKLKKSMGSKSNGRFDLQLDGDYVGGAFTEKKEDYLLVDTKDEKRDKFYKLNPWGLNEKNREIEANNIINEVQNELIERFTRDIT